MPARSKWQALHWSHSTSKQADTLSREIRNQKISRKKLFPLPSCPLNAQYILSTQSQPSLAPESWHQVPLLGTKDYYAANRVPQQDYPVQDNLHPLLLAGSLTQV